MEVCRFSLQFLFNCADAIAGPTFSGNLSFRKIKKSQDAGFGEYKECRKKVMATMARNS
jgi:hypothetical protein